MKRNKARFSLVYKKYIAPSILVLAPAGGWGAACDIYSCTTYRFNRTGASIPLPGLDQGGKHSLMKGNTTCINTGFKILHIDPHTSGQQCHYTLAPVAGVTSRVGVTAPPATRALNRLMGAVLSASKAEPVGSGLASSGPLKLAKITIHLTISELNNVPGGLAVTSGVPIKASQLSVEQRAVLMNHRGLIREALRQMTDARKLAEEPKADV